MNPRAPFAALLLALPLAVGAADDQLSVEPQAPPANEPATPPDATSPVEPPQPSAQAQGEQVAQPPAREQPARRQPNPADPFERWNRGVFGFNEALDNAVLKPVAQGYRNVVPEPVRNVVGNFFGNFGDAWSAVNHFLQGKPSTGLQMTMRVATNTVLGIGGLLDIATEAGLERQEEDFGQTLGRWGMPSGPYIVWPVLGPSAARETLAMPLDRGWSPSLVVDSTAQSAGLTGLNLIDTRARLLDATRMLEDVALDKYSFVRDVWLARRRSLVWDGDPPETPADNESDANDQPSSPPPR